MLGITLVAVIALGPTVAEDSPVPPPRLGLALSGGGARGFAHIGVLRALEECGFAPDAIAGTSMGALVGGLYAIGYSPDDLERVATGAEWSTVFQTGSERRASLLRRKAEGWSLLRVDLNRHGLRIPRGLVPTERLEQLLSLLILRAAGSTDFDRLRTPFRAVATDLETGRRVVPGLGSLATVLRASMAVPGVFGPVEIDGRLLFDGGLVDNLPVDVARELGADLVVAVDISSPLKRRDEIKSFFDVLDQAVSFRLVAGVAEARAAADLVIQPEIGRVGNFAFDSAVARDLITCGEEAGRAACAELRRRRGDSGPPRAEAARAAAHNDAVRVRVLTVTGAVDRAEALARRVFGPLPPDGILPLPDLEARLARVRAVGNFSRVGVELTAPDATGGELRLDVVEAAPIGFQLAARFDDKVKALGRVAMTWRRLVGPVRDLTTDVTFGEVLRVRLEARHDQLLGGPLLVSLRGFHDREFDRLVTGGEDIGELFFDRDGFAVNAGVALGRAILTAGYQLQWVRTDGDPDFAPAPAGRVRIGALVARTEIDSTDGRDYPTRGLRFGTALTVAPEWLGSEAEHSLVSARLAGHVSPWRRTVLHARAVGALRLAGTLPISEQPVGGGNDPFPGYPRDAYRGDRLGAIALGLRHTLFALPPAVGNAAFAGVEAGGGTVDGGLPELTAGGRLLYGVALFAGLDSRLGPIEVKVGFADDGHRTATFEIGPRF